ncbi:hypothetical protein ABT214_18665 [Micromonospora purpureochromogenes]|uniref:hypothetical protein n=1 Tax=Micromonospora purpureochromogenes TaxID=47872 RepID=UPI0033170A04
MPRASPLRSRRSPRAGSLKRPKHPKSGKPQPSEDEDEEPHWRESWAFIDLSRALDGQKPPPPEVLKRADGKALFYKSKKHIVFGESESMKTWLVLIACVQEIQDGHNVIYVDFEDDEVTIVARLLSLGAEVKQIRDHFHYANPSNGCEEPSDLRHFWKKIKPT